MKIFLIAMSNKLKVSKCCNNCDETQIGMLVPCAGCKEDTCVGCSFRRPDDYLCRWCKAACEHKNIKMVFYKGDKAGTKCLDCGKESAPTPKSKERKIKAYTWSEISRAIKEAYKDASPDSWNVAYFYEDAAKRSIRKALRKLK